MAAEPSHYVTARANILISNHRYELLKKPKMHNDCGLCSPEPMFIHLEDR
jgi:hypothetical protein